MIIKRVKTEILSISSYIIIDESSNEAIVIDPPRIIMPIVNQLQHLELKLILETHVHADFISGAVELKNFYDGKPLIGASTLGGIEWIPNYTDIKIQDDQVLNIGEVHLQAKHCPGHTPEHLMYLLYKDQIPVVAFTGDFLFAGSVGRPDLLGKMQMNLAKQLYDTIFNFLPFLPEDLKILPTHGAGSLCGKGIINDISTLKNERSNNPALIKQDFIKWNELLIKDMPLAPKNFQIIKKMNLEGVPLLKDIATLKKIDSNKKLMNKFLLDVRNPEQFAEKHIKGALNIPLGNSFSKWVGEFLDYSQSLILIANNEKEVESAAEILHLIGFDNIEGYVLENVDNEYESFPMVTASDLQKHNVEIIDVRTKTEWDSGHIIGAKHHELQYLPQIINELPKDKTIAFICGSGYRSGIAASLAQNSGLTHVCNIKGGMQSWKNLGLPMEK